MTLIRMSLLQLPFVREDAGTLKMWEVRSSSDPARDVQTGRSYGALWLHFLREFDAPHMTNHVVSARLQIPRECMVWAGFQNELACAIRAADLRPHFLTRPLVNPMRDHTPGDYGLSCARGRFFAAWAAYQLQDGIDAWPVFDGIENVDEGFRVGAFQALSEVAISSPGYATVYQKAMFHFRFHFHEGIER